MIGNYSNNKNNDKSFNFLIVKKMKDMINFMILILTIFFFKIKKDII